MELPADWAKNGIEVPATAVFSPGQTSPDQVFVWVVDEKTSTVAQRPVQLVELGDRGLRINGIEPGERIVTAGANSLIDGQKVKIQP